MAVSLEKNTTSTLFDASSISWAGINPATHIHGGLTINAGPSTVDWNYVSPMDDMESRLTEIEKRLSIINPDEILMDKYPALQEAYDAYKLIEKLVYDKQT